MSTINVIDSYTLSAGTRLTFENESVFRVQAASPATSVLTIDGSVDVVDHRAGGSLISIIELAGIEAANPRAVVQIGAASVLRITSEATDMLTNIIGFNGPNSATPDLVNRGAMEVSGFCQAYGVLTYAGNSEFILENYGSISAVSTGAEAFGATLGYGGRVVNAGLITATGKVNSYAVGLYALSRSHFLNTGTIVVRDSSTAAESAAVVWRSSTTTGNTFRNEGTLEGEFALRVLNDVPSPLRVETFTNTGAMVGKVDMGPGFTQLINSGRITGAVDLGPGADTYSGVEGRVDGQVSGGDGADSLLGGAGFDNFQGNTGADTVSTGGGEDYCVGGKDNDSLSGGTDYDLVYGNLGNDTCDGGDGNDIVRGGQDNDVCLGGAGADFVSGDKGDDTMTGGAGADIFHTFGDAGLDRVTDFSLAQGDRVQLDAGTVFTVSQVGADTVINMTGGGQMVLVGVTLTSLTPGWIFGA